MLRPDIMEKHNYKENPKISSFYLYSSLGETKPLLYNRCQFTDASSFLSQNILCSGGQYNDLGSDGSNTNLYPTVAIFC